MALVALLALILCSVELAFASSNVTVFVSGTEGYYCFKIPVLVVSANGTILALSEARTDSCSDFAQTALVIRRSYDNGATWGPLSVVYAEPGYVIGNAAPVVLPSSGKIVLPFCRNNTQIFLTSSTDNGETWTSPVLLENAVDPSWKWVGTGPPASIVLSGSGRIVTPCYHTTLFHSDGEISRSHVMFSDDDGVTWSIGGSLPSLHWTNECEAVDLGNNTVLINARSFISHRLQSISTDGGLTFGDVEDTPIPEPVEGCEMSTIRHAASGRLFLSGPTVESIYRSHMSLWTNASPTGDASAWSPVALIDSGPAGYSALAVLPDASLGLLYEIADRLELIMTPNAIVFTNIEL